MKRILKTERFEQIDTVNGVRETETHTYQHDDVTNITIVMEEYDHIGNILQRSVISDGEEIDLYKYSYK